MNDPLGGLGGLGGRYIQMKNALNLLDSDRNRRRVVLVIAFD